MALAIVIACVSTVGTFVVIVGGVFLIIRLGHRSAARRLEPEGIERRSERRMIHLRMHDYERGGYYSRYGSSRTPGELVLTKQAFVVLAAPHLRFENADLAHVSVQTRKGRLILATAKPPNATGKVEIELTLKELDAWAASLVARGAHRVAS